LLIFCSLADRNGLLFPQLRRIGFVIALTQHHIDQHKYNNCGQAAAAKFLSPPGRNDPSEKIVHSQIFNAEQFSALKVL
jgi:hypothetical protein